MKKLLTAIIMICTLATSASAYTSGDRTIPVGHWTYVSLKTLSEEHLIENDIPTGLTLTENDVYYYLKEAFLNITSGERALSSDTLTALRQLFHNYRDILNQYENDYDKMRETLEDCAIINGLTALETAPGFEKGYPLYNRAVRGLNNFSFEIFKEAGKQVDSNTFISPYSIFSALVTVYEGADGKTAEQIAKTLNLGTSSTRNIAALLSVTGGKDDDTILKTANILWPNTHFAIRPSYENKMRKYYHCEVKPLNYKREYKIAPNIINSEVSRLTKGKIENLIPSSLVTPSTEMIMTNAIYFNADWKEEFRYEKTHAAKFYPVSKTPVTTEFMHGTMKHAKYGKRNNYEILKMDYKNDRYSMTIILPDFETDLTEFERNLGTEFLYIADAELRNDTVDVTLPKFKTEYSGDTTEILKKMGMILPFCSAANFTKMSEKNRLMIDSVLHKSFIEVGEKGTEAAAATAVICVKTAIRPTFEEHIKFTADHPFYYIIRDNTTDAILFIGKYMHP